MNKDLEKWPELDIAAYGRPCFGERVNGDMAFADQKEEWVFLAIVDGLGHGKEAHKIATITKTFLQQYWDPDVTGTLLKLHEKLKGTGGAAVGLAALDLNNCIIHYTGIGNTVIRKFGSSHKRMFSREGVVGVRMRTPKEQQLAIQKSEVVLLYSDGISENFEAKDYPRLQIHSAQLVAKNIVRKFGNQFDDSTCLVLKLKP